MMFGTIFIFLLVLVGVAVLGGLIGVGISMWRDTYSGIAEKSTGAFLVLFSITLGVAAIAFITGDITFTSIPDGCYQIVTDTEFMPGSNGTMIPYNDRIYIPIRCP